MKSLFTSKDHPDSQALMSYAEGLVDSQALLNTEVAAHLKTCSICQAQVHEMRNSLRVINEVEEVEALTDLTASILLAAKQAPSDTRSRDIWGRTTILAATLLITTTIGLGMVVQQQPTIPVRETASYEIQQPVNEVSVEEKVTYPPPIPQSTPAEVYMDNLISENNYQAATDFQKEQVRHFIHTGQDISLATEGLTINPALVDARIIIENGHNQRTDLATAIYMGDQ